MTIISNILPAVVKSQRKECRMEKRREQIVSAAAVLFAGKGCQRATTREIADEAGVS